MLNGLFYDSADISLPYPSVTNQRLPSLHFNPLYENLKSYLERTEFISRRPFQTINYVFFVFSESKIAL